jgi:glycerophosphoryl diester phosphodiesterase
MRTKWLRRVLTVVVAVAAVLAAAYAISALLAQPAEERPFFAQLEYRPLVMAHQGGKGLRPENTLSAFEHAVVLGVDVLEMDIHTTADGVPVVMHDETVDDTTNGTGPILSFTLAELKELDAGYDWTPDDGQTFPYRGQNITVPTLEEVFAAFPGMPMNIEIKQAEPSMVATFCQLIRDYERAAQVLVASFDDETIAEFREECPEVATSTSTNETVILYALSRLFLEATYGVPADAAQVPEYRSGLHVLAPRFVDAAHNRNLEVHAWTINDDDDLQRMIDLGVDGIITDYPDRLLALLGR